MGSEMCIRDRPPFCFQSNDLKKENGDLIPWTTYNIYTSMCCIVFVLLSCSNILCVVVVVVVVVCETKNEVLYCTTLVMDRIPETLGFGPRVLEVEKIGSRKVLECFSSFFAKFLA